MGNRAIIQTRESYNNDGIGIYLHWNGGYDSVSAFLKYCELKGYRSPDTDSYGWARLCQVIGNYFGGGLSLGIDNFSKDAGEWQDNGTYIIEGWQIVDRKFYDYEEQDNYSLIDMLLEIDAAQPTKERLGADFILAKEVSVSSLKVGDVVYLDGGECNYSQCRIAGFGSGVVNGRDMTGVPYVAVYGDNVRGYDWNINNYIRTNTVKIASNIKEE